MNNYSWSYSAFSTALICLRKFKLLYIDKMEQTSNSIDLAFGTAIHTAVNASMEEDDGTETFDALWNSYSTSVFDKSRNDWAELSEIGKKFVAKFERLHKPKMKPHTMEKRLYSEYRGIRLEGTMDYAGTYNSIPTLLDYKTSAYRYDKDKTQVSLQLYLYTYLCIKELGYTPQQIGYMPFVKYDASIQGPILIPFDEKNMYEALDEMVNYINIVNKHHEFPRNFNSCIVGSKKCDLWDECHNKVKGSVE